MSKFHRQEVVPNFLDPLTGLLLVAMEVVVDLDELVEDLALQDRL